jgi:hypothetical protein
MTPNLYPIFVQVYLGHCAGKIDKRSGGCWKVLFPKKEVIQRLEKLAPDPKSFTYFRTGIPFGRLPSLLRFIQQVPRNLTFSNKP